MKPDTCLTVVLLSGGLDSCVTLAEEADHALTFPGRAVKALTFKYGQKHMVREVAAAMRIASAYNMIPRVVSLTEIAGHLTQSTLIQGGPHIEVPRNRDLVEIKEGDTPSTYVPMRNLLFLTIAAQYAESILDSWLFTRIDRERVVVRIAFGAGIGSRYPDCQPEFVYAATDVIRAAGNWRGANVQVCAPVIHRSKREIIERGVELHAPLAQTWSCYMGNDAPCGACDACTLRVAAFKDAGMPDPALRLDAPV